MASQSDAANFENDSKSSDDNQDAVYEDFKDLEVQQVDLDNSNAVVGMIDF